MFRIYIERKTGFQNEAGRIFSELTEFVGINNIKSVRFLNRYDIEGLDTDAVQKAAVSIFSEPQSDLCYFEDFPHSNSETIIICEYLPGQYDQRSDSAEQCLSLFTANIVHVGCAKVFAFETHNPMTDSDKKRITKYLINPVDSRIACAEKPLSISPQIPSIADIPLMNGFIDEPEQALRALKRRMNLAMDDADILFLQAYFKSIKRNPTETEIRVLDTYWSDHCRHTTFMTHLNIIDIQDGEYRLLFERALSQYMAMRTDVYADRTENKPITLMDMATIGAKYLKKHGKLDDIELSDEINACSLYIDVHYPSDKSTEKWLLMFKNETHNHPTEIEPFGGAATCIGGAIRDPLSGRSWVYQAMRVSGCADPRNSISAAIEGKLPQIKLTREAANGFSSYGNQIGLTTGQVTEIYHEGFEAKRMELGAVIGASPASQVKRETPEAGDVVILLGGGTGRDGIGGATGSSKVHTADSVTTAGSEVQKGNAVEERKIQRLFRNEKVSSIIRRCNDFGAGGVAVAVGELANGLHITLDAVPKKYEGLNGTEIAISESQERMAVVVRKSDASFFIQEAERENIQATIIAEVTDTDRLVMTWRGVTIVDLDRSFLDTAGAVRKAHVYIESPDSDFNPINEMLESVAETAHFTVKFETPEDLFSRMWFADMSDLATCSQRGLAEKFDGTIGSGSVLFPFGGSEQATVEMGMVAKIPAQKETTTSSIMTFAYDPRIASWSPYHGAQIAVLHSVAKIAALGGNAQKVRLTFQEYFESVTTSEVSWGKPAIALLGALDAQKALGTASIGGKDSMSGTFRDIYVPPTLVSFAVVTEESSHIVSGAFKKPHSSIIYVKQPYTADSVPDFDAFKINAQHIYELISQGKILASYAIGRGGIAEALSKMAFGNGIGFEITDEVFIAERHKFFFAEYGGFILEINQSCNVQNLLSYISCKNWSILGNTIAEKEFRIGAITLSLQEVRDIWEKPLAKVFPPLSPAAKDAESKLLPLFACTTYTKNEATCAKALSGQKSFCLHASSSQATKPLVLLPVFPGTNCEYDMKRAFDLAGSRTQVLVFRNHTKQALQESICAFAEAIAHAQIIAFSGGFSAGDEPDGSGKYIASVLRQNIVQDALMNLIDTKDSLILGICNGFQALIKTGLVPYGKIMPPSESMPTLTYNTITRHISRMVRTKITSSHSAWALEQFVSPDEIYTIPISHGEGRVIINEGEAKQLFASAQIFSQYVDITGKPTMKEPDNPNGSYYAIEGMTNADGRILGKMAHNERALGTGINGSSDDLLINVGGNTCQNIFASGVSYFL